MTSTRPQRRPSRRRAGFTLIELLTVMGVMAIITSIIATDAFGVTRGASFTSAREIPYNVLQYARQRACMDGRVTIAYFADDGDEKSVGVFQAAGTLTDDASGRNIVDRYSSIAEMSASQGAGMLTVWNFTQGKGALVESIKRLDDGGSFKFNEGDAAADGERNEYLFPVTQITMKNGANLSGWRKGDAYGFEISERMRLPKDFSYSAAGGAGTANGAFWITFFPDGRSDNATVTIAEAKVKNGKKMVFRVQNGTITEEGAGS